MLLFLCEILLKYYIPNFSQIEAVDLEISRRHTCIHSYIHTYKHTHAHTGPRHTSILTYIYRHTDTQAYRHIDTHRHRHT